MDFHTWTRRQAALESIRHAAGLGERDREELEGLVRRGRELWIEAAGEAIRWRTTNRLFLLAMLFCLPQAKNRHLDHTCLKNLM